MLAKLAATRSTCLSFPVGAVIVKNQQVLATGYNGSPSGSVHCIAQGYCYPGLSSCDASRTMPSRAVHAEANAIAQAAKHGISTEGACIYVTREPCLSCLKLIISAGIREVFYETSFNNKESDPVRDSFIAEGLVTMKQIELSEATAQKASLSLINPTSVVRAKGVENAFLSTYSDDKTRTQNCKVYVSGALTEVENPVAVKDFYERIGSVCETIGLQAYVPHRNTDPIKNADVSPRQVFEKDKHEVSTSNLVIAYLGSLSYGVGMELAYAEAKGIPIILLYEEGKRISRFPRGIPTVIEEIQFYNYEDALEQLKSTLERWKEQHLMQQLHIPCYSS